MGAGAANRESTARSAIEQTPDIAIEIASPDDRPARIANQCRIVLVKDQGVYFLAERGERRPDGRQQLLAYAVGRDPFTSTHRHRTGSARDRFTQPHHSHRSQPAPQN